MPMTELETSEEILFCPGCGYDLRGSRDGPCSECGMPIDRAALIRHWQLRNMLPAKAKPEMADDELIDRYAEQVGRIDAKGFDARFPHSVPLWLGNALLAASIAVGVVATRVVISAAAVISARSIKRVAPASTAMRSPCSTSPRAGRASVPPTPRGWST